MSGFAVYLAVALGHPDGCANQRAKYAEKLNPVPWLRYRDALENLLGKIDRFFGYAAPGGSESRFWRPWNRCLSLAFVYPILFFVIVYAFGIRGDLAGIPVFDHEAGWTVRLAFIAWIFACNWFVYMAVRRDWFERGARSVVRIIVPNSKHSRLSGILAIFFVLVAGAGAGAVTVAVASAVAFAVTGAVTGAVAVSFAFAFAVAVAGVGVVAVAVAGAGAGAVAVFNYAFIIIVAAFYVIFPIFNSLLDWASVTATRLLMRRWVLVQGPAWRAWGRYVAGVFADLVFAVICICALSALLSAGVSGVNAALFWGGSDLQLDWLETMKAFRDDPTGDGLMITLMLFSTLVPTIFHLTAGTAVAFKLPHLGRDYVMRALADGPPAPTERLWLGVVITSAWLIPAVAWSLVGGMLLRFLLPLSWLHAALGSFVPASWLPAATDGYLLLWLPYKCAELVWIALGG